MRSSPSKPTPLSAPAIDWPYPEIDRSQGYLDYVYHGPLVVPIHFAAAGPVAMQAGQTPILNGPPSPGPAPGLPMTSPNGPIALTSYMIPAAGSSSTPNYGQYPGSVGRLHRKSGFQRGKLLLRRATADGRNRRR